MSEVIDNPTPLLVSVGKPPPHRPTACFRPTRFAAITVSAVLTAAFGGWYLDLQQRVETLSAEVRRLDEEWATASTHLDDARRVQPKYEAFLNRAKRVAEEGDAKRWTPALRSIALRAGIELREIHVAEKSDHSLAYRLHIEGVSTGSEPRAIADRFLRTLQSELGQQFQVAEPGRFERLEDEKDSLSANLDRRAAFTITVTIVLTESAKAEN